MGTIIVIDGKAQKKQRLSYIPREGEIVEIRERDGKSKLYVVDFIQHRIDLMSTYGIVDTLIHIISVKKKGKKKGAD